MFTADDMFEMICWTSNWVEINNGNYLKIYISMFWDKSFVTKCFIQIELFFHAIYKQIALKCP